MVAKMHCCSVLFVSKSFLKFEEKMTGAILNLCRPTISKGHIDLSFWVKFMLEKQGNECGYAIWVIFM